MKEISIVIPMFNEEKNVRPLFKEVTEAMENITSNYEIIFVDDGSTDNTFEELKKIFKPGIIKIVKLRRNFGKATALAAGFEKCEGKIVITMDGDLQDEPREIPLFLKKLAEGYDFVNGWKVEKHKGSAKRISSKIYNIMASVLTGVKVHDFNCSMKAFKREVLKDLNLYGEMHRYIPAILYWKGYKIAEVKISNYPRKYGKTKYGSKRLIKGFLDLITMKYLMSYRTRPLHLFGSIGIFLTLVGFFLGLYLFIIWLGGKGIGDRPLLLLSVLLMVLGIQFGTFGLLGEMITNMGESIKKDERREIEVYIK